jgi:hypothetical protein
MLYPLGLSLVYNNWMIVLTIFSTFGFALITFTYLASFFFIFIMWVCEVCKCATVTCCAFMSEWCKCKCATVTCCAFYTIGIF